MWKLKARGAQRRSQGTQTWWPWRPFWACWTRSPPSGLSRSCKQTCKRSSESEESSRLANFQLHTRAQRQALCAAPRRAAPRRAAQSQTAVSPRRAAPIPPPDAPEPRAQWHPRARSPLRPRPRPTARPPRPGSGSSSARWCWRTSRAMPGHSAWGPSTRCGSRGAAGGSGEGARAARGPAGGRAQEKTNVCARAPRDAPSAAHRTSRPGKGGGGSRTRAITCPPRARGRAHGAPPLRAPRQDVQRPPRCHFPLSVLQNAPPRGKSLRRATRRETAPSRRPRGIYGWRLVVGPPGRPAGRGAWPGAAASNSDSALGGRVARKQTRRAAPCGRMRPAAVQCVGRP